MKKKHTQALAVTQPARHAADAVVGSEEKGVDEARQVVMGRWRSALASGLRTALACTIVGLVSLHAPAPLRRHITFPAFSYVVTVIIVTDATLGTALRGAVSALHATLMGAAPSVLALWLAHRTGAAESVLATSAVVALTTFAVALPESVGPVEKRIALGQIIIIYVARFRQGESPTLGFALLHPANVVVCTALGVVAALLAVLLPWPRLATREAAEKSRSYKVLAVERVRVMADAFCCCCFEEPLPAAAFTCRWRRRRCMAACMLEAKRLESASTKLLHRINSTREDAQWERDLLHKASGLCKWAQTTDENMEMMETHLTGMQMALAMIRDAGGDHRDNIVDDDLVMTMRDQIRLALLTPNSTTSTSMTQGIGINGKALLTILSRGYDDQLQQQLAPLLFLSSIYHLHRSATTTSSTSLSISNNNKQVASSAAGAGQQQEEEAAAAGEKEQPPTTKRYQNIVTTWPAGLMAAAKCGFSLGLAVLLGLLFSNDHGFWSGLIVATTMAAGRDSTWALAIARAHGTALGSVYGVLGCLLIPQRRQLLTMDVRFLVLLPWMVLATFLKRSRAYGPAGGVAAALSAIIIMGRRCDEPPMAFTIARLVETFIGISCVVLADLVFQPGGRPSVQARTQLTRCITAFTHCFITPPSDDSSPSPSSDQSLRRVQKQLALLRKCMAEAKSEPTYLWLPPFPASTYDKIEGSLSRMAQLLYLCLQARTTLVSSSCVPSDQLDLDAMVDVCGDDFNRVVSTSFNHCRLLLSINSSSLTVHDDDLEAGHVGGKGDTSCNCHEEEEIMTPKEAVGCFLTHARETLLKEDNEEVTEGQAVCCLASLGLCMGEIIMEAFRLEAHILDLASSH